MARKRRAMFTAKTAANTTRAFQNAVRLDFRRGITTFKKSIDRLSFAKAVGTGKPDTVFKTIPWKALPGAMGPVFDKLNKSSAAGAKRAVELLPAPVRRDLAYDLRNPAMGTFIAERTVDGMTLAQRRAARMITTTQDGTMQTVRTTIKRGFKEGLTHQDIAERIRGSIGLTEPQAIALANYRASLAVADVKMSPAKQQSLVDDYCDRMIDHRAMVIARTETRLALNEGQLDVWNAAADGDLLPAGCKRVWVVDGAPCEVCAPMDGVAVALDQPWIVKLPNGTERAVMNPCESHPCCLCLASLEIP